MQTLKMIIGLGMASFSSLFLIASLAGLLSETGPSGVVGGLFVFFFITFGAGVYLTVSGWKKKRKLSREKTERSILRYIMAKGGRVTALEVAAETPMSVEQAQEYLQQLCNEGLGEVQLTSNGNLVYVFHGALGFDEKLTSKSPLDIPG